MKEVVVTTGAIRHAKRHSNRHHQHISSKHFYSLNALPVAQPSVTALKGEHTCKD